MADPPTSRYARQIRLPFIGEDGQARIARARVSIVGLGALGTIQAAYLARAGVGELRLVDRDSVELHNLQRQVLYTERDVSDNLPKAVAAERRLAAVNSEIRIEGVTEHLGSDNVEEILAGSDLVLDGTDNFETRFLLNDFCVRGGIPWIYGACVGTYGLLAVIVPGLTPCLRCLVTPEPVPPEPTCDTEGILGSVAGIVGSLQATRALQILSGELARLPRGVIRIEAGKGRFPTSLVRSEPDPSCPACRHGRFEFLEGRRTASTHVLCGRDAVQIIPADRRERDLEVTAERLSAFGEVRRSRFLLKARIDGFTLSLFSDGRIIVGGTVDPSQARTLVDRLLGGA